MKETKEGSKKPQEITNNLHLLSPGDTVTVVSSDQGTDDPIIRTGRLGAITPSPQGPLMLILNESDGIRGLEGAITFAGSGEGISVVFNEFLRVVFHNPNIPFPYFPPGQIDLLKDPAAMAKRHIAVGLYPDLDSWKQATGEDLQQVADWEE